MSNVSTKKVFVESVAEQQEHLKTQRKTLKVLQTVATDKENLTGRPTTLDKLSRLKAATDITLATTEYAKRKKIETRIAETQTSPDKRTTITADDLIGEAAPGEHYWSRLAEKRRVALEETLTENQQLNERIEGLEDELNTSRKMLEEARNLVEVLTEMLSENEAEREIEAVGSAGDDEDANTATATATVTEAVAATKRYTALDDDEGSETRSSAATAGDDDNNNNTNEETNSL